MKIFALACLTLSLAAPLAEPDGDVVVDELRRPLS